MPARTKIYFTHCAEVCQSSLVPQRPCCNLIIFAGGGGTFGVVFESTVLASPRVTLQTVIVSFTPTPGNSTLNSELWTILADNGLAWADEGWGGFSTSSVAIFLNPNSTTGQAATSMAPLIAFGQRLVAAKVPGAQLIVTAFPSWKSFFDTFTQQHVAVRYYSLCTFSDYKHSLGRRPKPCTCISLDKQKQFRHTCLALYTRISTSSC
jgi:hypothetical protein